MSLTGPEARALQSLSGSVEAIGRWSTWNPDGLRAEGIRRIESFLMLRARPAAEVQSGSFSGNLQAYGVVAGERAPFLRFDEGFAKFATRNGFVLTGGIQRYSDQYSYYWNPTFPVQYKTDLARPDYLAGGVPMISLAQSIGPVTPRAIVAWDAGEAYPGVQVDGYLRGLEAYVNGFWSQKGQRTAGAGVRKTLNRWTLHVEGGPVWRNDRLYPASTLEGLPALLPLRATTWRIAAGANRSVGANGLVTFEYLHDDAAYSAAEFAGFCELMQASGGAGAALPGGSAVDHTADAYRAGMLRRDHIYAGYHHSVGQKWKFGVRSLLAAADRSGYIQPSLSWLPTGHAEIGAELFMSFGSRATEFGLFPVRSTVSLKIRYYM